MPGLSYGKRPRRHGRGCEPNMKRLLLLIVLVFLAAGIPVGSAEEQIPPELAAYLPQPGEPGGRQPTGTTDYVRGEDLFLLINGGAEIYHEYGFKQTIARGYKHENGKAFNLEIYEMNDAAAAYGIYTFKTGDAGKPVQAGREALLEDYYLNCWQGNFLVTVIGFDDEPATLEAITEAAKSVTAKIKTNGTKPSLVALLPTHYKTGKKPVRIKYLKGNLAFYNLYQLDSADIFGVKEGVYGDYRDFKCFIFKYNDAAEGKKWFDNAAAHLKKSPRCRDFQVPGGIDRTFYLQDENNSPVYVHQHKQYITAVLGKKPAEAGKITRMITGSHGENPPFP